MIEFIPIPTNYSVFGLVRVPWWGTFFLISIVVFVYLYILLIPKYKVEDKHAINILIHWGFWSFIWGHFYRIIFVTQQWHYLFVFNKGFDSFGIVFGFVAALIYMRIKKLDIRKYFDHLAIPIIALLTLVRVGCALVADETAKVASASLPWAIFYKEALRHPVGVYYLFSGIIIMVIVIYLSRQKLQKGNLFLYMIGLYSLSRVFLDYFREIPPQIFFGFSIHQIAYGLLFVLTLILFYYNNKSIGRSLKS